MLLFVRSALNLWCGLLGLTQLMLVTAIGPAACDTHLVGFLILALSPFKEDLKDVVTAGACCFVLSAWYGMVTESVCDYFCFWKEETADGVREGRPLQSSFWVLLRVLRLFHVFFVSLLFRMLMYCFTFCMFSRALCKFRFVYICVIPSCSCSASLSSGTLRTSWFSEPRCQHFGKHFSLSSVLYFPLSLLPSSVSNLY